MRGSFVAFMFAVDSINGGSATVLDSMGGLSVGSAHRTNDGYFLGVVLPQVFRVNSSQFAHGIKTDGSPLGLEFIGGGHGAGAGSKIRRGRSRCGRVLGGRSVCLGARLRWSLVPTECVCRDHQDHDP